MWHSPDHSMAGRIWCLCQAFGAPFLTMHESTLERSDLDEVWCIISRTARFLGLRSMRRMRALLRRSTIGKVGFIQLGWASQGACSSYEASTECTAVSASAGVCERSGDYFGVNLALKTN